MNNISTNPTVFRIVGSFYRPPATAILNAIPIGTPLSLRAEPDNAVDPNAIAVYIQTRDIPETCHKSMILSGANCGFRIGEDPAGSADEFLQSILAMLEWHVGYIPAILAKTQEAKKLIASGPTPGRFVLSMDGKPSITLAE